MSIDRDLLGRWRIWLSAITEGLVEEILTKTMTEWSDKIDRRQMD